MVARPCSRRTIREHTPYNSVIGVTFTICACQEHYVSTDGGRDEFGELITGL
jgi:hypothetical protein